MGISGWSYPGWRGDFYPEGLVQRRELEYAAQRMTSIEINGSFYSLQRPSSYAAWRDQTPDDFVFAVKGGRFITHMKKLADVEVPLANFYASGVLALGAKTGPYLWQLPPSLGYDAARLASFFDLLPRTLAEAARLAEGHDAKVPDDRALTTTEVDLPLRHALEVRHRSFTDPELLDLLREHDVALVVADTAGRWPLIEEPTSDHMYVRLHGDDGSVGAIDPQEPAAGRFELPEIGVSAAGGKGLRVLVEVDVGAEGHVHPCLEGQSRSIDLPEDVAGAVPVGGARVLDRSHILRLAA